MNRLGKENGVRKGLHKFNIGGNNTKPLTARPTGWFPSTLKPSYETL
jgi:hypothetical protein